MRVFSHVRLNKTDDGEEENEWLLFCKNTFLYVCVQTWKYVCGAAFYSKMAALDGELPCQASCLCSCMLIKNAHNNHTYS